MSDTAEGLIAEYLLAGNRRPAYADLRVADLADSLLFPDNAFDGIASIGDADGPE